MAQKMGDFTPNVVFLGKTGENISISLWVRTRSFILVRNCAFILCSGWLEFSFYAHCIIILTRYICLVVISMNK